MGSTTLPLCCYSPCFFIQLAENPPSPSFCSWLMLLLWWANESFVKSQARLRKQLTLALAPLWLSWAPMGMLFSVSVPQLRNTGKLKVTNMQGKKKIVSVGCNLWWTEQGGIWLNPSKEKSGCTFRNHSGEGGFLKNQLSRKGSLGSEHSYAYIKK